MSEKKTIQINPELFKVQNTTRKKKSENTPSAHPKIKLKSSLNTQKQSTLRKNVLKMIREKQQESYRELFDSKPKPTRSADGHAESKAVKEFNKDFDDTVQFFSTLSNKVKENPVSAPATPHNISFKNREPEIHTEPFLTTELPPIEPCEIVVPLPTESAPQYGCLKNGSLPTWRNYTRKNGAMTHSIPETEKSEIVQKMEKTHGGGKKNKRIKYLKRKKIFKRTFHIGRNKTCVGVLISNKTIRNRITTEAQLLKQTPIKDVRRFLIKKGFIKVGSNTPNDVLRKMYETVSLVCGEIQNHNPENLLYNFIHDNEPA